jgi:phosphinothricin acetyltransferase
MNDIIIRPARESDLSAMTDMYNFYVRETPITFDIMEVSLENRRDWFSHYSETGRYRMLIAERDSVLVGYAGSSKLRPKAAYGTSVETTVYVHPDHRGQAIGSTLYAALFELLSREDVHRAYAGITLPNEASIRVHCKFGFKDIGTYHEVGRKFGRYWDVAWLEKEMD